MEIDEGRLLAALRSCELEPNDLIALRNFVTASLDPVQLVCSFNIESNSECSEEIHPPIGKITTIVAHWKLKENGFGHHFYLQWLPPESIDSEIESYYININNYIFETQSSIPEFQVDILDPESSEYRVRILAVGQNDLGEFSEWVVAKELDPSPAPTRGLRCIERRDDSLKFWWGDEKSDDDDKIFTLEMKSGKCCYSPSMDLFREQRNQREKLSFTPVYSGPSHSFKLEDLVPDTEYEIRICASNLAGEAGPYSEVSTFSTSHIVPHTVRTFRALTKMEIEWRTWDKAKKLRLKKLRLGAKKYSPVILKLLLKARKYRPSARKYPLRIRKHPLRIRKGLQRKPPPHSRSSRGLEKSEYFPPRTIRTSPATRKCGICVLENKRIQSFNEEHGTEKRRQVPILRAVRDVGVIPLVGGVHIKWLKPLVSDYCSFSYNVKMNNLSFNTNDDGRDIAIKGLDPDASYR